MTHTNQDAWLRDVEELRARKPKHILFLCVANSARSQLAEGVARMLAPAGVKVSSAGSSPSRLNPAAVAVMKEIGVDISSHYSKSVDDVDPASVDAVVTLCAEEVCPAFFGKAFRIHWGMPDPASPTLSEEDRLQAFRNVRDELRKRLGAVFS